MTTAFSKLIFFSVNFRNGFLVLSSGLYLDKKHESKNEYKHEWTFVIQSYQYIQKQSPGVISPVVMGTLLSNVANLILSFQKRFASQISIVPFLSCKFCEIFQNTCNSCFFTIVSILFFTFLNYLLSLEVLFHVVHVQLYSYYLLIKYFHPNFSVFYKLRNSL